MDSKEQIPVLEPGHTFASVTDKISSIVLTQRTPRAWWIGFGISFALLNLLLISVGYLFLRGVGIWGINIPVGWAFAIINLVWWIGIGHAGTLISAILLIMRQDWRTSINRFAEAMTLFAVANAAMFPLLHLGRPWFAYYIFPYPNTMGLWPQFRSPLVWDAFAIATYGTVSALFWYMGLIPDLATLRDRARNRMWQYIYGILAMGWRGSARHWHRYQTAYFLMAALATPLVVSVHSIIGLDFAYSVIPGWHSSVFPPYFVAGAVFSGFAMVLTLAIPLRKFYNLEDFITLRHLDNMAKVMLGMGLIVAYGYLMENFYAWYSGDEFEIFTYANRSTGDYNWLYFAMLAFNVVVPQAFWSIRVRRSPLLLFIISILINIGMWLERFIIIVTGLYRDFLPSSWEIYRPTFWEYTTFLGTIGLFLTLIFLFIRFVPVISIFEMRELVEKQEEEAAAPGD
jgi:molybdopterin-containing oxidoreductase family membrane subunit